MADLNNIQFKVATQFFAVFQITRKIIFEVRYNVRDDDQAISQHRQHYLISLKQIIVIVDNAKK